MNKVIIIIIISAPVLILQRLQNTVRIKRGSSSFNSRHTVRNNALQKQWSSSEFLNCYVHVST